MDDGCIRVTQYLPPGPSGIAEGFNIITRNQQILYDLLVRINRKEVAEMAQLEEITAEVTHNTEVDQSAIVLLNGLSAKLTELANDPAAIAELAAELAASSGALAEAVVANTPAEVPPPVEPEV